MKTRAVARRPLLWSLLVLLVAAGAGLAAWPSLGGWVGRTVRLSAGYDPGKGLLETLDVYGEVPDFALTERSGRRITRADLLGKVWIANFIYTHCTETCPLQSAQMARLQANLQGEPDVRLVSITVDPEQDTPQVLAEYASRFGADRERWLFLTGERRPIYTLALEGFRLSVADPEELDQRSSEEGVRSDRSPTRQEGPSPQREPRTSVVARILRMAVAWLLQPTPALAHPGHPGKPFIHSSRFVLVDRQARIRGYYQSNDNEALQRLRNDVRVLLRYDRA